MRPRVRAARRRTPDRVMDEGRRSQDEVAALLAADAAVDTERSPLRAAGPGSDRPRGIARAGRKRPLVPPAAPAARGGPDQPGTRRRRATRPSGYRPTCSGSTGRIARHVRGPRRVRRRPRGCRDRRRSPRPVDADLIDELTWAFGRSPELADGRLRRVTEQSLAPRSTRLRSDRRGTRGGRRRDHVPRRRYVLGASCCCRSPPAPGSAGRSWANSAVLSPESNSRSNVDALNWGRPPPRQRPSAQQRRQGRRRSQSSGSLPA